MREDLVGNVYDTNFSGKAKIVEYINSNEIKIVFLNTGSEVITRLANLKKGKVKDYSIPTVFGVGIKDVKISAKSKIYVLWADMLRRCYDPKYLESRQTYRHCEVSYEFRKLSSFKEWCEGQIGFDQEGFVLDKDILVKGNKLYSRDTCAFVPRDINQLILKAEAARGELPVGVSLKRSGVYTAAMSVGKSVKHIGYYPNATEAFFAYKTEKENYIKVVANKWKDLIDVKVYESLMNWKVEIED